MIVLDTHIWVWWVHGDTSLTDQQVAWLQQYETLGLGVCAISCWEIAKSLFEKYICRVRTAHQPLAAPAGRQVCSRQH